MFGSSKCLDDLPSSLDKREDSEGQYSSWHLFSVWQLPPHVAHPKKRCHSWVVQSITLMNLQDGSGSRVWLPAICPDCTCIFLLSVSHSCVFANTNQKHPYCSLSRCLWRVKPDVERLLTEEQINVCISADWFIALVLFDQFSWLMPSSGSF